MPGNVFEAGDGRVLLTYFDSDAGESRDEIFDLIVLSVGIAPGIDLARLADLVGIELAGSGFVHPLDHKSNLLGEGIFAAGTVLGPMSIAESIASAEKAAWEVIRYLKE